MSVNVRMTKDGVYLTQPHLVDQIIHDTEILSKAQDKLTSAPLTTILSNDSDSKVNNHKFNYHSVIGKLNFLEKSTRPDITYAVYQCA